MHRREFVELVLLVAAPVAACSGSEDAGDAACDGEGASTTTDSGHRHSVCVPAADISSPPAAGATYTTSFDDGHDHQLALSAEQLSALASGVTIVVETTVDQGHGHSVTFTGRPVTGGAPSKEQRGPR